MVNGYLRMGFAAGAETLIYLLFPVESLTLHERVNKFTHRVTLRIRRGDNLRREIFIRKTKGAA